MAEVLDRLRVPGFLRLRLELRGDWLHIAARDGSPRLLRLVTARDPEAEGGHGLWLVEQLGRACSYLPGCRGTRKGSRLAVPQPWDGSGSDW